MAYFTKHAHRVKLDRNDNERRVQLGRLLRRARKELGFTQEEVARALGYKRDAVCWIELAKRTCDFVEVENFAHLYGKELNYFATWSENQEKALKQKLNK